MWAFRIEFLHEIVESGLLLKAVPAAVVAIAEPELAFDISTPEVVRGSAGGEWCALGDASTRAPLVGDEAVAIEHARFG